MRHAPTVRYRSMPSLLKNQVERLWFNIQELCHRPKRTFGSRARQFFPVCLGLELFDVYLKTVGQVIMKTEKDIEI